MVILTGLFTFLAVSHIFLWAEAELNKVGLVSKHQVLIQHNPNINKRIIAFSNFLRLIDLTKFVNLYDYKHCWSIFDKILDLPAARAGLLVFWFNVVPPACPAFSHVLCSSMALATIIFGLTATLC